MDTKERIRIWLKIKLQQLEDWLILSKMKKQKLQTEKNLIESEINEYKSLNPFCIGLLFSPRYLIKKHKLKQRLKQINRQLKC